MDAQADEAASGASGQQTKPFPELAQLVMQLRNFVNMEREHADKLFALLIGTMGLLARRTRSNCPRLAARAALAPIGTIATA